MKFITTPLVLAALLMQPSPAAASESDAFVDGARDAIVKIIEATTDNAPQVLSALERLIADGAKLAETGAHELPPADRKLVSYAVANIEGMKALGPDDMEDAWHHGEALHEAGLDLASYDHFSPAVKYYDMIVHPATAYVLVKQFHSDGDRSLLQLAKGELEELLDHSIDSGAHGKGDAHHD